MVVPRGGGGVLMSEGPLFGEPILIRQIWDSSAEKTKLIDISRFRGIRGQLPSLRVMSGQLT